MNRRNLLTTAWLTVGLLVGSVALVGCTAAESKPLNVTYYYLPG